MSQVLPSITAYSRDEYNAQLQNVIGLANRVHIDISDGIFSPHKTVGVESLWWPAGVRADIHVMYKNPESILGELLQLKPRAVIVHAEADGDFIAFAKHLHAKGIQAGIALLPDTPVSYIYPGKGFIDQALIFSGDLGSFGGTVDLDLLTKATEIAEFDKQIEIGWDGGVNDKNIKPIAAAGVGAIVSGGFIQKAENPAHAYKHLKRLIKD